MILILSTYIFVAPLPLSSSSWYQLLCSPFLARYSPLICLSQSMTHFSYCKLFVLLPLKPYHFSHFYMPLLTNSRGLIYNPLPPIVRYSSTGILAALLHLISSFLFIHITSLISFTFLFLLICLTIYNPLPPWHDSFSTLISVALVHFLLPSSSSTSLCFLFQPTNLSHH